MRNYFDKWRDYTVLTESQLLAEGRKEDAASKYPEVAQKRVELDGENLLDILIAADPSGNQKYLMNAARLIAHSMEKADRDGLKPWWGKITAYMPDTNEEGEGLYAPYGITNHIANLLPRYHKLMPYIKDGDEPFKDMGNILTSQAFRAVVTAALTKQETAKREKEQKKRLSKQARDESRVIETTDYHIVRRPESEVASCHYGRGTTWCVTATKSQNYWDTYKKQGKSFYFINTRRNDVSPDHKIMTLVYGPDGELDDDEPRKNAANDTLDEEDFMGAIMEGLLGTEAMKEIVSFENEEPYNRKIIIDTLSKTPEYDEFNGQELWQMLQTASRNAGNQGSRVDHEALKDLVEMFKDDVVRPYINKIYQTTQQDVEDNPVEGAGSEEDFDEMRANFDFDHLNVYYNYTDEYVDWGSSYTFDIHNIIEEQRDGEEQISYVQKPEDHPDDYIAAIEKVLENMNTGYGGEYGDDEAIQQNNDPEEFSITMSSGMGNADEHGLDEFNSFLHDADYYDSNWTDGFRENLYEYMLEKRLIKRDEQSEKYWPNPEERKQQIELPLQEGRLIKIKFKRRK